MIIQMIGAFIAVASLSIIFEVPKKYVLFSGIVGMIGQMVYLLAVKGQSGVITGAFLSALAVALLSHIMARFFKAPVIVFLIPGILPVVPGIIVYRAVYSLIQKDNQMAQFYLLQSLQIAAMIALAIFLMDSVFRLIKNREGRLKFK